MAPTIEWHDFLEHLRYGLNHLYDPKLLQKSPLIVWFGLENYVDAVFRLQKVLADSIEQLDNDSANTPFQPQILHILKQRYIEQIPQVDLAKQVAMSDRQLRREQNVAIEYLATRLWNRYINGKTGGTPPKKTASSDLNWLTTPEEGTSCDPNYILVVVRDLVDPLVLLHSVTIESEIEGPLPLLHMHSTALQQALLNSLSLAVEAGENQTVYLSASQDGEWVEICISYPRIARNSKLGIQEDSVLSLGTQLLDLFSAQISLKCSEEMHQICLRLPVLSRTHVLVVDDNKDFLELMQRYTAGTRFKIYSLNPHESLVDHILTFQPALVILDIMMPRMDGWELLRILRSNESTKSIPVIISTILPQESLAMAMGASGFLQKPITQESLMRVLENWCPIQDRTNH